MSRWEEKAQQFQGNLRAFARRHGLEEWEAWFAPYDDEVYRFVLERLHPTDVVLDIGAGDFRLAEAAAKLVKRVYAIEVFPGLVADFLSSKGMAMPQNLHVICANALDFPFPADVTVGILLMRHCQHFSAYFQKLKVVGAQSLFTNARWKMGIEEIDLKLKRVNFDNAPSGWYACECGAIGFKGVSAEDISVTEKVHEVKNCPQCIREEGVIVTW